MTSERRPTRGDPAAPEPPDEGFEAIFTRLEAVSQQLEAGGLSLEQSLALYEEGMLLAQRCQLLLGAVEQRIETLRAASPGPSPGGA